MSRLGQEIKSTFESEQQEAMLNVIFTANWLRHFHNALLREFGISVPQYNILRILRGAKGQRLSMQDIRARMVDRSPNATRLTDALIEKGLVDRERCTEDRRVVRACITTQGLAHLKQVDVKVGPVMEQIWDRWGEKEAEAVNRYMDELRGEGLPPINTEEDRTKNKNTKTRTTQ